MRPLDQFVIGAPVRLSANRANSTGDPAFRIEHATDQEFDEGPAGADRRPPEERKSRSQEAPKQTEALSDMSEYPRGKLPHWSPRCSPWNPTPGEQRGDPANRIPCQIFILHSLKIFFVRWNASSILQRRRVSKLQKIFLVRWNASGVLCSEGECLNFSIFIGPFNSL